VRHRTGSAGIVEGCVETVKRSVMRGSGGSDKTYAEGKTYKSRGNYPTGWCPKQGLCKGLQCDSCIKISGKYTGFEGK